MNNMRRGFTMIELIFVIVIIGILAAVAIPKLAATRDDAKISSIVANARTFKGDLAGFYTAQGASVWDVNATNTMASTVPVKNSDCVTDANTTLDAGSYSFCDGENECLTVTTVAGGSMSVVNGADTTSAVCLGVQSEPTIVKMKGESPISFGGSTVNRN